MKQLKAFLYFFGAIFCSATIGFALAFLDSIELVQKQQALIVAQQNNLADFRNSYDQLKAKLNEFYNEYISRDEHLLTKLNLFKKRYPLYDQILEIVIRKSKEYGYNPALVLAIIQIESNFNPYAVSAIGAYGLMQIHYAVWKDELKIKKEKLFDPEYNIDLGLKIFKSYHLYSGNISQALHLYNNGFLLNNQKYSQKVISAYYSNIQTISCQN